MTPGQLASYTKLAKLRQSGHSGFGAAQTP